jgi:hypothetical protein
MANQRRSRPATKSMIAVTINNESDVPRSGPNTINPASRPDDSDGKKGCTWCR